jgi:hypothetical protein
MSGIKILKSLLEGSMNGVALSISQAKKARAAGMLRGAPDVQLPVARGPFIGLKIELKYGVNDLSPHQRDMLVLLAIEHHACFVAYDWEDAKDIIMWYVEGAKVEGPAGFRNAKTRAVYPPLGR